MGKELSERSIDLSRLLVGAQLPALPQSAIRVIELSHDPENGPAEFAVPIESEPGLASQVLRFVNSSYFGFSREISSVKLAIILVGIRTIKNFVLWSAVYNLVPNPRCGALDLKKLWQDSLRRGLFARTLGKTLGAKDVEVPFAAALLQDMAVPLLAKELPEEYADLLEKREGGQVRLSDLEQQAFGWNHAKAAKVIASQWNLPAELGNLVDRHTEADVLLQEPDVTPAQKAIVLSALLPSSADETWVEYSQFETAFKCLDDTIAPTARDLLGQIDEQFSDFAPLLRLPAPSQPLVACYDQQAEVTI